MTFRLLITGVACMLLSVCRQQHHEKNNNLPQLQQLQDTVLMIKARTFRISHFELADSNHVVAITQDETLILSDTSDYFEKFEILDFNQDQVS